MIVDQKLNKSFVGVFLIDGSTDGTQLATTVKPSLIRRYLIKFILGWKWISIRNIKNNNTNVKDNSLVEFFDSESKYKIIK
jgi:hypothetical protein